MNRLAGITAAILFIALLMPFTHRLYLNHRWDSACCVAIALTLLLLSPKRPASIVVAGFFAGWAAVSTPPTLLVPLTIAVLLALARDSRRQAILFTTGALLPLALTAAVLSMQSSVTPMLRTVAWVGRHYSQANRVPYGFTPPDPNSSEDTVSALHRALVFLPAALPILACAAVGILVFRRTSIDNQVKLLLAVGLALAASCYPRIATSNLLFAAPLFLCLLIFIAAQLWKPATYRVSLLTLAGLSSIGVFTTIVSQPATAPVLTQLGTIEVSPRDLRNVRFAASVINPGDTLFVFPYQPIWYSLTGGINPSRFDFLQPGMMTLHDEADVLSELKAHPPEWVIWHNLPPRTVLAIWPHSDPVTLHFKRIEQFIRTRYSQAQPADREFRYAIAIFHLRPGGTG